MDAKKRKVSANASQRMKLRRSVHDKSEFVSVEVGMREFKKRLAATGVEQYTTPTTTNQVEDLTQAKPKTMKTRAKPKTASVQEKVIAKSRITAAMEKKDMPVKRTTRSSTRNAASTLSLAQVKLQLKHEQEERVEQRIQMLHREEKPIAAASAVVGASIPSPVRPETSVVATDGLQKVGGDVVIKEEIASKPMMSVGDGAQTCTSSALATTQIPASAGPVASNELQLCPIKNEFIADDLEEDLMFAMALEETEKKLATPQKLPPSSETGATTDLNTFVTFNSQVPVASPVPAMLTTVKSEPVQVFVVSQQQMTKTLVQSKQAEAIPEVLEEMERLRRENKLLRRSNELLQAAVTPPPQANICGSPGHSNGQDGAAILPQDSSMDTPAGTSTARFLDLGRCGSDQKRHSSRDDRQLQEHVTDSRSTASERIPSAIESEYAFNEEKNLCEDQHKLENEKEPATEPDIATEHASKLSHKVSPQKLVATTPLSGPSAPIGDDIHLSTQPTVAEHEPVQERETAPLRPRELLSTESMIEGYGHVTNGFDDGEVPDASMAEVDDEVHENDENEEEIVSDNGPSGRMSTIDRGNHAEYKVRQENDHDDADDEYVDETRDSIIALKTKTDAEPALPTHVDLHSSKMMLHNEPATWKPGTPMDNDILDRTTAPSNSDDENDNGEDELMSVNRRKRREPIALSSSESESESEEDETSDTPSLNVLEAALHAAGGDRSGKNRAKPSSVVNSAASDKQDETKDGSSVAVLRSSLPSKSAKIISEKRKTIGLSSASANKSASIRSSLLWPALDEFYDFLLDMSPKNVRGSERKRVHLRQYAGGKLPVQYSSIEEYCGVQLEAIMEELMASVSNTTDRRSGGGSGPTRHLPLTSVSPCGVQRGFTSSTGLSFGAIFSESGFTGSTSSSNDYILTFDPSALGKKSSSEFLSGDLVLVRSPRWKKYEMCVFGVVLCGSVVAGGGNSGSRGKGGGSGPGDDDQICVLVRAHKRDQDDAVENFSVLSELCLSNQRAPNWRWSVQQVHNTTTSAREFQAIKAISFLPNDLQQALMRGRRLTTSTTKQTPTHSVASSSVLSPRLLKYLCKHYNDSQVRAILGCLGEDNRVIIQGPPGTGKTKTILGLLSALLDGAGLSTLQKTKGTARVRVGASLQSAQSSAVSKTVAGTSIRVLVAAPSNAAVDELVVRVLSEGLFDGEKGESYRPQIVRVGRPESSQQLSSLAAAREASGGKKNRKKMRKYAREVEEVLLESLVTKHRKTFPTVKQAREAIIKSAQIVFCTLSGAGSVAMCEFAQDFDALIIDEAAQAVEASTLIPFKFRPHRVVLVGDHRQLPATVISKTLVSMGYDRSLQQRLVENDSLVLLLTQQYRMHPEIAEFPSTYFYGGRLVQDDNMSEWTAQNYHCDPAFKPLLFYDVQGAQSQVSGSTSLRNMNEVEAVVQLVRRLVQQFPQLEWKKRIGVIAPYKQQICEVRNAMGKLETEMNCHLGIEVNTVDGFQGREKEIIIYSCVRTSQGGRRKRKRRRKEGNDTDGNALDAFWADERRMNVAITRAKSSLWIVGNATLLTQSFAWKALIQHMKDHNRYISDTTVLISANS